mmetsp:Transcript_31627/g.63961  ORF Transcript_31627/g.63961 Transcript_31627/m.63961 type:complete len:86 (+) Transcript_31627:354-611(+)
MLRSLVIERQEVKMEIAAIGRRADAVKSRHRVLHLLYPTRSELANLPVQDLLLLFHIHGLPSPPGISEKQDLVQKALDADVCAPG